MNVYEKAQVIIEELLEQIPTPPDENCSCHISPPCNDCVDWAYSRNLIQHAKETVKLLQTFNLLNPEGPPNVG